MQNASAVHDIREGILVFDGSLPIFVDAVKEWGVKYRKEKKRIL